MKKTYLDPELRIAKFVAPDPVLDDDSVTGGWGPGWPEPGDGGDEEDP